MTDKTYNGWSTYETWLVNLWISQDQELHEALRADVVEADTYFDAKQVLVNWAENELEQFLGHNTAGLFVDLLRGALSEVNWYEIVRNWREEE